MWNHCQSGLKLVRQQENPVSFQSAPTIILRMENSPTTRTITTGCPKVSKGGILTTVGTSGLRKQFLSKVDTKKWGEVPFYWYWFLLTKLSNCVIKVTAHEPVVRATMLWFQPFFKPLVFTVARFVRLLLLSGHLAYVIYSVALAFYFWLWCEKYFMKNIPFLFCYRKCNC